MIKKYKSMTEGTREWCRKKMTRRLRHKYGESFLVDIEKIKDGLRFVTLDSVGKKYNLTRERVRQIFFVIYGCGVRSIKKRIDLKTCKHDPRIKVAEFKEGIIKQGAVAELKFFKKCCELGFDVKPECGRTIDQNVNGYKVEIKASYSSRRTSEGQITKHHHYSLSSKQIELADFFACYHFISDSFFIIPKNKTPFFNKKCKKEKSIYITVEKSKYYCAKNRYWEFQNAWHLLEVPKEQAA